MKIAKIIKDIERTYKDNPKCLITISFVDKDGRLQQGSHVKDFNTLETAGLLSILQTTMNAGMMQPGDPNQLTESDVKSQLGL